MDSYRYLDFVTRQFIRAYVNREPTRPSPWAPLRRPLEECTVALVSTAGIARKDDVPFDEARERENPWWGDPTGLVQETAQRLVAALQAEGVDAVVLVRA